MKQIKTGAILVLVAFVFTGIFSIYFRSNDTPVAWFIRTLIIFATLIGYYLIYKGVKSYLK